GYISGFIKSSICDGIYFMDSITCPSAVCLKFVKFHLLIFVLSGFGSSKEFAKSKPSRRNACIHSGSLCFLENCSIYSLSKGNFVTVVIEISLLTIKR